MGIIKNIEKLKFIHTKIKNKSTGSPQEFANKIGVSRSHLYECLDEIKSLGGDVKFCRIKQTFYYKNNFEINIEIKKN